MTKLEKILKNNPLGVPRSKGPVRVLVELKGSKLDDDSVKRLEALGLQVKETIGTKIIGSLDPSRLDKLRADPDVLEVEVSVPLERH